MLPGGRPVRLVALATVAVGVLLAADGPEAVGVLLGSVVPYSGLIIIGVAVAAVLHNVAPRGSLAGPIALGAIGLAVVITREGRWPALGVWPLVGAGLAAAGGIIIFMQQEPPRQPEPVRRIIAAVFNRRVAYRSGQDAPERLSLVAVGCRIAVDLTGAGLPRFGPVEINIACLAGHVEIAVPGHWPVVAGRVATARGIRMTGQLDSTETFADPHAEETLQDLDDLVERRRKAARVRKGGAAVVVHVAGFGGRVAIADR